MMSRAASISRARRSARRWSAGTPRYTPVATRLMSAVSQLAARARVGGRSAPIFGNMCCQMCACLAPCACMSDDGYFPRATSILPRVHDARAVGLLYGQRALAIGAIAPLNYIGTREHTRALDKPFQRLTHTAKAFE